VSRPGTPIELLAPRAMRSGAVRAPADAVDARIAAAALELLRTRGVAGTTMADVSRAAGIGRATLFRRFGSKDELFEHVIAAELQRFLGALAARFAEVTDPTERICETFAASLRLGAGVLLRAASIEQRAALVATLAEGSPSSLDLARAFVAAHIRAGQRAGHVRAGDPDTLADGMIRVVLGYLLVPGPTLDPDDERSVRRIAVDVIAPMVLV
jgi:AcrR family transcriptional regulator